MTTFICISCATADGSPIDPDTYLVDTDAQRAEARRAMRATGWRPTHRIVTRQNGVGTPETVDVCLHDGVAYTAHEWASQSDADWEVSDDGEWLYRGEQYPGAYEVTEL